MRLMSTETRCENREFPTFSPDELVASVKTVLWRTRRDRG
jgi:hypothetical protein